MHVTMQFLFCPSSLVESHHIYSLSLINEQVPGLEKGAARSSA